MLSYRHAFHAGNYADVLKHVALLCVLRHLVRKPGGVRVIDTHAGAGGYRLDSAEALKTGEFRHGIARLWECGDLPEPLARYVAMVREFNGGGPLVAYPGSPWFALQLLRPQDRLELCELHPRDFEALQARFAGERGTRCHFEDGFSVSAALLPPVERRGLVLIDPSYELKEDYDKVVDHVAALHRRFATGAYMVWYPVVERPRIDRMERAWRSSGMRRIHVYELSITDDHEQPGMTGAGVVVVNPPWTLDDELRAVLACCAALFSEEGSAHFRVETLVGE